MNLECPTGQQMQTSYYILILASNLNDHTSLEFFDVYVPGNKRKQDVSTDLSSTFFQLYFRQEHQQNPNKCILATQYFTSSLRISSRACSLHVKVQCLPKLILQFQPSGSCKTNCIYASLVFFYLSKVQECGGLQPCLLSTHLDSFGVDFREQSVLKGKKQKSATYLFSAVCIFSLEQA